MNYKIEKLKDVAQVITGKTPSTSNPLFYGGNISFISPADLNNSTIGKTKITLTEIGAKQVPLLPKNSVLVSCIGNLGKVGILDKSACFNQQINALVFDESKILPKYGFYFSLTLQKALEKAASKTVIPIVNKSKFSDLEISYPDLPTQTKIAQILDKADQIRQKRKKAIELADEFLRSLFLEMFGDPVVNPKGWITKPIKEVINNFNEKDNYKDNDNIWLLNLDMIKSHTGEIIEKQFCQYKNLNNSTRYFDGSTILYNKLRPYLNKVVIPKENEHGYCTTELVALQPNTQFIDRYFLAYYLRSKEFLEWAEIKVAGAKMPRLNMNDFWMKDIYIPSLELQNKFAQIVKKTEFKKRKLQSQLKNMDELFNSLSQQYFTKVE